MGLTLTGRSELTLKNGQLKILLTSADQIKRGKNLLNDSKKIFKTMYTIPASKNFSV
jgi:hypothetical protein